MAPINNPQSTIQIREVWSHNLIPEFHLIRSLIDDFPFVSMDTEFPGVLFNDTNVFHNPFTSLSAFNYYLLKLNVDALNIIQLGLTLTDSDGNFPNLGDPKLCYIWQFNFKDFDVLRDSHAPESVELLRQNGIDFEEMRLRGVDSFDFAELMMSSGLVCCGDDVTWVTFHCAYDFGYLIKVLTRKPLPSLLNEFIALLRVFFGPRVFDVKYMIRFCDGLYGGLNKVARFLKVDRTVGRSHQAGSDSLVTWFVFKKLLEVYFSEVGGIRIDQCAGVLYGLDVS